MTAMGPAMAALLLGRIEQEAKAGVVTAYRAALLTQLLDDFMRAVPAADDDVRTHEQKTARMREIVARLTDTMASQSRRDPRPVSKSQAERVDAMLGPLQQFLVREMAGPRRPAYETEATRELFARDQPRFAGIEERAWRVALDTHQYARRYHQRAHAMRHVPRHGSSIALAWERLRTHARWAPMPRRHGTDTPGRATSGEVGSAQSCVGTIAVQRNPSRRLGFSTRIFWRRAPSSTIQRHDPLAHARGEPRWRGLSRQW